MFFYLKKSCFFGDFPCTEINMAESLASNHDVAYVTLQREILRF